MTECMPGMDTSGIRSDVVPDGVDGGGTGNIMGEAFGAPPAALKPQ